MQSTLPRTFGDTGLLIVKVIESPSCQKQESPPQKRIVQPKIARVRNSVLEDKLQLKDKRKNNNQRTGSEQYIYITVGIIITEQIVNSEM